jgi:hypothetical protein
VAALPGRGLGCVALEDVPRGTRLLVEPPLTVEGPSTPTVDEQLGAMPERCRRLFWRLAQDEALYGGVKSVDGVVETNGIPMTVRDDDYGAVFATASRFNHSCEANTVYRWNSCAPPPLPTSALLPSAWPVQCTSPSPLCAPAPTRRALAPTRRAPCRRRALRSALNALTVTAVKDVSKGSELTFNYGFGTSVLPRSERRAMLASSFGFACACAKCALPAERLAASDGRIGGIGHDDAFRSELLAWAAGAEVAAAVDAIVARMEARYALVVEECGGVPTVGVDALLQLHVEFCGTRRAHRARDRRIATAAAIASANAQCSAPRARSPPQTPTPCAHPCSPPPLLTPLAPADGAAARLDDARRAAQPERAAALAEAGGALRRAAARWAGAAAEFARDVGGEDSPALALWRDALARGCWEEAGRGPSFRTLWAEAHAKQPLPRAEPIAAEAMADPTG